MTTSVSIKASEIFDRNYAAPTRIVVNQGGTSSGKTYSILQVLYVMAMSQKLHISVCAVTLPHLKKGALKDFIDILTRLDVYDEGMHNKSDQVFTFQTGSKIEFFSLDNPGKARGPRRDILFINECNLIPFETFTQLNLRTGKKVYIDYNPADEFHWIYEQLLNGRDDVTFIQSTYKDNPFLAPEIIREIERLQSVDENLWKIYGLGERGQLKGIIYPNWQTCDTLPEGGDTIFGLDFGYNNPTALVQVVIKDKEVHLQEMIYESHLTNNDLIERLKILIPNRQATIYADAAEPQRIQEIYQAGFNVKAADKEVKKGIDVVKTFPVFVTKNSINIQKERNSYKWKVDLQERTLDEPVKFNDHCFVAGTKIRVKGGIKNIEHVRAGDYVQTSKGYKRVISAGISGQNMPVFLYKITSILGQNLLYCTDNHHIKTSSGWKEIQHLQVGDAIYQSRCLMELFTSSLKENVITAVAQGECMLTSGSTITEKFLRATTYTIKTITLKITTLQISNLLRQRNIYRTTGNSITVQTAPKQRQISTELDRSLLYGTGAKMVLDGTGNMRINTPLESFSLMSKAVDSALKNFNPKEAGKSFAQIRARVRIGANKGLIWLLQIARDVVLNLAAISIHEPVIARVNVQDTRVILREKANVVYDISVEEEHEYFADRILVHNCMDAIRYAIHTHHLKPKGMYAIR